MKTMRLKYWCLLVLSLLLAGACSDGELEGDLYPVSPDHGGNGGNNGNSSYPEIKLKGIEFVYVKGGTFSMGATNEQLEDAFDDELPVRTITLTKDYYIGKYEITQAQWKAVMGNEPSDNDTGGKFPVENVSWYEVQQFINKLNASSVVKYRLPTEAEWEYAARGGQASKKYKFSGSNVIKDVAWYEYNSSDHTHAVGGKNGNELGIYDMSGNVFEWCNDWYGNYRANDTQNPQGAYSSNEKVLRGGSYEDEEEYCRVSYRSSLEPDEMRYDVGFRLVAEYDPSKPFLVIRTDGHESVTAVTSKGYASYIDLFVESSDKWSVSVSDSWITYTVNADTLHVKIDRNPSKTQSRSGSITITAGNQEKVISIKQDPFAEDYLKVSTAEADSVTLLELPGILFEQELVVSSSGEWRVEKDVTAQWLNYSVDKKNNKILLSVSKNIGELRTAWLTVLCGETEQEITIRQKKYSALEVEVSKVNFLASGGEKSVKVFNNTSYTCSVSAADSWCIPSVVGSEIKIIASANTNRISRITQVYITCGSYSVQIAVEQEGNNSGIYFETESMVFQSIASTQYINVYGVSGNWSCSSDKTWCTVSKSGSQVKVYVTENTGSERNATVTVTSGSKNGTFMVNQSGKVITLSVSPASLSFEYERSVKTVSVMTNASSWSYSNVPSWCTMSKSGNQLSVTVSENSGSTSRSGSVTISAGGKTTSVNINQSAKSITLSVSPTSVSFDPNGESRTITVSTNASSWSYSNVPSWCNVTKETNQLIITASENSGTINRSGVITFSAGGKTTSVTVSQAKKEITLSLNPASLSFTSASSTKTVIVTTNASSWTYDNLPSWCTASKLGDQLEITTENNENTNSRKGILNIVAGDKISTLNIEQEGNSISVSKSEISCTAGGYQEEIVINSSDSWDYSISETYWCKIQKNENSIVCIIDPNFTNKIRSTTLKIQNNTSVKTILISQGADWMVGDYYKRDNIEGVVYLLENRNTSGLIISMQENYCSWIEPGTFENTSCGATSPDDGVLNTERAYECNVYLPIFVWCKNLPGYRDQWYIPSKIELQSLLAINHTAINKTLKRHGGTSLTGNYYWSSTEYNGGYAYACTKSNSNHFKKTALYTVRAICKVNF